MPPPAPAPNSQPAEQRKWEVLTFLFLSVVLWPVIAIAVVGGWGLLVWMYQLIAGPPGPPA